MHLKEVPLKKSYSSDTDDILFDFLIPTLEAAQLYRRLAGFFSSSSLAVAARGIVGLIRNGGSIMMIVSPRLSRADLDKLVNADRELGSSALTEALLDELEPAKLQDRFTIDHVGALGWMLARGMLSIRVAIPVDQDGCAMPFDAALEQGIFHPKVGILTDAHGNAISFSGSINESATAWRANIEEFKVFRSWESGECEYAADDVMKFERFWERRSPRVKVLEIPDAVRQRLISIAPVDPTPALTQHYCRPQEHSVRLFQHQLDAVSSWAANKRRGLFEMATGTGKTVAALGCIEDSRRTFRPLVTVIACPYGHLLSQWRREFGKFGLRVDRVVVADGTNPAWKASLADSLADVTMGFLDHLVVLTTHRTLSSTSFTDSIRGHADARSLLLVADECHGLGADRAQSGLLDTYSLRLGLSATPARWFDSDGTRLLVEYFGGVVYEFGLDKAINTTNPATGQTYLTPFRYLPVFVPLTDDELVEYMCVTQSIVKAFGQAGSAGGTEDRNVLELLLFRRANITKNATCKLEALDGVLDHLGGSIRNTIIYCTPAQIDRVMKSLNARGVAAHRFTMAEGTTPRSEYRGLSVRDYILQGFGAGRHKVLVAMKCLDEGVDVPPAERAIFLASSGNPREFVQRIGRVLRRWPGKAEAVIHDIVVAPLIGELQRYPEVRRLEMRIFDGELRRYEEIASHAVNSAEALSAVFAIRGRVLGVS